MKQLLPWKSNEYYIFLRVCVCVCVCVCVRARARAREGKCMRGRVCVDMSALAWEWRGRVLARVALII